MDEVGLGRLLQDARKRAGLTQQQLCQKSGLSYSTLAKIERGAIKAPSIFTIQSIAEALGVSLGELVGDIAKQPENTPEKPKKRSKTGVRFVYFDINGCLVRFYHRAFTQIAHDFNKSPDAVETIFWHYNDAACRGEMSMDEFNRAFAEKLGVESIDWSEYYLATVEPIPGMHELVAWAADNYYVGLLSNIMPGLIDAMLDRQILPKINYSAIIDSSKTGSIKPEQHIFEAAQHYTNCPPEEVLLVDDSRANMMAAEKFGWHVMWFDDFRPDESVDRVRKALEPESD